jgi:hypothetical protein
MTKKARRPNLAKAILDRALVWHGATVLSGQADKDSRADAYLRRACIRYLKATPKAEGRAAVDWAEEAGAHRSRRKKRARPTT